MKLINPNTQKPVTLNKVPGYQEPSFLYLDTIGKTIKVDGHHCRITTNPNKHTKCVYIRIMGQWYYFVDLMIADDLRVFPLKVPGAMSTVSLQRKRSIKNVPVVPIANKARRVKELVQGFSPTLYDCELAKTERNDCTIRAIMECLNIRYEEAHKLVTESGCRPRPRKGTYTSAMMARTPYFRERFESHSLNNRNVTVAQFLRENPKGTFLVIVTKHAFAIKDGIVIDFTIKPKQRVRIAWKLK